MIVMETVTEQTLLHLRQTLDEVYSKTPAITAIPATVILTATMIVTVPMQQISNWTLAGVRSVIPALHVL